MSSKLNKLNDTIAALATAPGRAGLAVVRVSGPLTKQIAKKTLGYAPKHMAAKYSSFKTAEGEIIDLTVEGAHTYISGNILHEPVGENKFTTESGPSTILTINDTAPTQISNII